MTDAATANPPQLITLPAGAGVAEVMAVLRRDGAVIIDRLVDAGTMAATRAEVMPWVEATPPGRDSFTGHRTTRTGALVARSPRVRDLILDPLIRACADDLLLPFCERWQLHLSQVIRIMPGQAAQAIHRDRWAWGVHLAHVEPQLNTIWAMTDFTAANGATQVVPGSLDWADSRQPAPHEIARAEMAAGSVLIYSGGVFHGGGANFSDADRLGLNLTYTLGWLRQEENQYLACPPAIARTLPAELQKLIGYQMGSYALGYYSPPLPPGAGPEIVGPEFALRADDGADPGADLGGGLGSAELLAGLLAKVNG